MKKVQLGDKVRDNVTGFTGIAVGRTTRLHGCDRLTVQPEGLTKDGKTYESQSFDEPQLKILKSTKVKEGDHATGGPRPEVFQKETPSRL